MSTTAQAKDRPILFSAPMVRAILEGRKTQTRRIVKMKKDITDPVFGFTVFTPPDHISVRGKHANGQYGESFLPCPYGGKGMRLWVRETHLIRGAGAVVDYRADMDPIDAAGHGAFYGGWKPSLFMRREHSRITLEVVSVRVERLQDISGPDVLAEGVGHPVGTPLAFGSVTDRWNIDRAFRPLWESINGPGSWDANPWVWVVEFKRI